MTDQIEPNEDYTYGSRISTQLMRFVDLLTLTPNTNQAILQVAMPGDHQLTDPPCLRHIDMRVKDGTLVFYPYFRSWDLWGGFPANLAGIAVLQRYMADEIGVDVGPMIASSKGLHIYGYVEELARIRTRKQQAELSHGLYKAVRDRYCTGLWTDREEEVLRLRLEDHWTRSQVAAKFNVTGERIRQIEAKALRKLRIANRKIDGK